ncbi:ABC transporter permease [Pontibacter mangrovi]|uniref:ABC transporter permease n=1 Tax=Pontibacter mangrovi TaxID=2589816 RepID=A0A501W3V0_9BACT|nr:ABC transporter permease [Pontibacter mangrovi]TPE43305.1 ABC transporter permease [Pontibacter mangrovi]
MRHLWHSILKLWRSKWGFRLALVYLLLFVAVALILPWLPLPFSPSMLDTNHTFLPPLSAKAIATGHWLGTDGLGRDVFTNTLFGARTTILISFPVMLLATALGLVMGTGAGFWGNDKLKLRRSTALAGVLASSAALYYGLYLPLQLRQLESGSVYIAGALAVLLVLLLILGLAAIILQKKRNFWSTAIRIPVDAVVMRITEAVTSVPRFVVILVLASFVPPSLPILVLLLVLTLWPDVARLSRAEMARIKQLSYFEAGRSMGTPPVRLVWRHALPNLVGPVLVAFTFGLGGLLALESTLSFLNIGVPSELVSWGRIIAGVRSNTSAWWLVAIPGTALSVTILALYTCSHYLSITFGLKRHS